MGYIFPTPKKKDCEHDATDDCGCECSRKPLDVNKYATKKTIAQGMLDIALLTANASQLKYVLQVGEKHEFYTLMLTLISISIVLQIVIGVFLLTLNLLRDCRLHVLDYKSSAITINVIVTSMSVAITVVNLLIGALDPTHGYLPGGGEELVPRLDYFKVWDNATSHRPK